MTILTDYIQICWTNSIVVEKLNILASFAEHKSRSSINLCQKCEISLHTLISYVQRSIFAAFDTIEKATKVIWLAIFFSILSIISPLHFACVREQIDWAILRLPRWMRVYDAHSYVECNVRYYFLQARAVGTGTWFRWQCGNATTKWFMHSEKRARPMLKMPVADKSMNSCAVCSVHSHIESFIRLAAVEIFRLRVPFSQWCLVRCGSCHFLGHHWFVRYECCYYAQRLEAALCSSLCQICLP